MASYEEFSDPAFSSGFIEEPSRHSWRPAPPSEGERIQRDANETLDDGVHLSGDMTSDVVVGSEPDSLESLPRVSAPPPARGPSAGAVMAACFGVALIALFVFAPGELFTVSFAVPAALLAVGLAYYLRQAVHPVVEEPRRRRAAAR